MRRLPPSLAVVGLVAVACGGSPGQLFAATTPAPSLSPSPSASVSASVSAAPVRRSSPVDHLVGVGSAAQVVSVIAAGYGSSYATVTAYEKSASGWRVALGPWPARIGRNGFAAPGRKREGDGRTPSGSYGFSFFFGVETPPTGLRYPWRHASSYDVWDDDPTSRRYNRWVDTRIADAGRSPEPMHQVPAYDAAAVIAYNTARTLGMGSAIFFHVSHSSATAGCIAVAHAHVLAMLRWLDPRQAPRIIMGTRSVAMR
jgi:L,D-peptidoglycan transpeptidase YkuD (ErfK/YbiS/YcfS/YnhG family)